jgi:hypothetical protein
MHRNIVYLHLIEIYYRQVSVLFNLIIKLDRNVVFGHDLFSPCTAVCGVKATMCVSGGGAATAVNFGMLYVGA